MSKLVSYINQARHRAFVHAVEKQRTISDKQGYIVAIQNYLSFRIPFEGDIREDEDIQDFMEAVQSFKEGVIDSLSKYNITARTVTAYEFKLLLRTLLNYATPSEELARRTQSSKTFHNEHRARLHAIHLQARWWSSSRGYNRRRSAVASPRGHPHLRCVLARHHHGSSFERAHE